MVELNVVLFPLKFQELVDSRVTASNLFVGIKKNSVLDNINGYNFFRLVKFFCLLLWVGGWLVGWLVGFFESSSSVTKFWAFI